MRLRRIVYITLLEILIALAVIAMTAGLIAFNIRGFYAQQEALDEMARVSNLLKTAQDLMMLVNLDSEVRFTKSPDGMRMEIWPKSTPPLSVKPLLNKNATLLTHITANFENADTVLDDKFALQFVSKGFKMDRGVLHLNGDGVERSIILHGYPAPTLLEPGTVLYPYSTDLQEVILPIREQTFSEMNST